MLKRLFLLTIISFSFLLHSSEDSQIKISENLNRINEIQNQLRAELVIIKSENIATITKEKLEALVQEANQINKQNFTQEAIRKARHNIERLKGKIIEKIKEKRPLLINRFNQTIEDVKQNKALLVEVLPNFYRLINTMNFINSKISGKMKEIVERFKQYQQKIDRFNTEEEEEEGENEREEEGEKEKQSPELTIEKQLDLLYRIQNQEEQQKNEELKEIVQNQLNKYEKNQRQILKQIHAIEDLDEQLPKEKNQRKRLDLQNKISKKQEKLLNLMKQILHLITEEAKRLGANIPKPKKRTTSTTGATKQEQPIGTQRNTSSKATLLIHPNTLDQLATFAEFAANKLKTQRLKEFADLIIMKIRSIMTSIIVQSISIVRSVNLAFSTIQFIPTADPAQLLRQAREIIMKIKWGNPEQAEILEQLLRQRLLRLLVEIFGKHQQERQ